MLVLTTCKVGGVGSVPRLFVGDRFGLIENRPVYSGGILFLGIVQFVRKFDRLQRASNRYKDSSMRASRTLFNLTYAKEFIERSKLAIKLICGASYCQYDRKSHVARASDNRS